MSEAGKRILAGLQDAMDGNFAAVTIDGVTWVRKATSPAEELIEKMARAIWKLSPYRRPDETWETSPEEFRWRRLQEARAAYSAEHERQATPETA